MVLICLLLKASAEILVARLLFLTFCTWFKIYTNQ